MPKPYKQKEQSWLRDHLISLFFFPSKSNTKVDVFCLFFALIARWPVFAVSICTSHMGTVFKQW